MATESPRPAVDSSPDDADQYIGDSGLTPMMARSLEAFYRDLPELLKTHYHQWVVYHGDERLWFGRTETELYKKCERQGLKPTEFLILGIEREMSDDEITM